MLSAFGFSDLISAGSRAHVRRTLPMLRQGNHPQLIARVALRRPVLNCGASTHVHARPRIEGKITVARVHGVTQHDGGGGDDDANDDEIAHNLSSFSRFPFPSVIFTTLMCNNPYQHGWLPLLGLHNRVLIDNLYGACRLFDYPPPAGSRRLDYAHRATRRRRRFLPLNTFFSLVVTLFFHSVLSLCQIVLAFFSLLNDSRLKQKQERFETGK